MDKRGGCGTNTITGPTFGPNALRRNTWVHLAAVYDPTGGATDGQMFGEGSSVRNQYIFYINGAPYYNNAFASFLPNRMNGGITCEIGCRIGYNGRQHDFFDGLIDEVRVLERALSQEEIQVEMGMPWCTPLIMHFAFNEGHGHIIHDASPNGLHVALGDSPWGGESGTLAGAPSWARGRDAVCGTAMELATDVGGSMQGDCFKVESVPFGEQVTISLWAKLHSDAQGGPGGGGQLINCHGDGGHSGGHTEALVLETKASTLSWQGRTWISDQGNNAVSTPYEMEVWTHLALVYDPSTTRGPQRQLVLYVDGTPHFGDGTEIWENMLTGGGGFCSVGCHPAAGADGLPGQAFFNGLLDELRIYDGALTVRDVQNDFRHRWCTASPPPPPPGVAEEQRLLLFYAFDEGDGHWVSDSSGNIPPNDVDLTAELAWNPNTPPEVGWVSPGVCGSALEFFTNSTGDCVNTPVIDVGEAMSISAWVFLHSAGESLSVHGGPQGSEQVVNCHGGMSLVLEAFPNEQVWRVRTYNGVQGDHYVPGATITPNRWTHLAVVFDPRCDRAQGNAMSCTGPNGRIEEQTLLYVDGVAYSGTGLSRQHGPNGDGTMPDPMVWRNHLRDNGNVQCTIGCHPGHGGQAFFDGLIDEVRIFDRALTAMEVREREAQHSWCARAGRGPNYHFTSFEEPEPPGCACPPDPGLRGTAATGCLPVRQSGCENSFPRTLAQNPSACRREGCEVTNAMSTIVSRQHNAAAGVDCEPGGSTDNSCGDQWVENGMQGNRAGGSPPGTYTTTYVAGSRGNAELGFRTYWQSCGDPMLSGVACSDTSDDSDNTGVISMYNVGPSNGNTMPPNYVSAVVSGRLSACR